MGPLEWSGGIDKPSDKPGPKYVHIIPPEKLKNCDMSLAAARRGDVLGRYTPYDPSIF